MPLGANLLPEPEEVLIPAEPEAEAALAAAGDDLANVAATFPGFSGVWAALADQAFADGEVIASYAYARTGYHRGLDRLRAGGWKGFGPVPWSHEPNRGVLRSIYALGRAAASIGETEEAQRCQALLEDCDPAAIPAMR